MWKVCDVERVASGTCAKRKVCEAEREREGMSKRGIGRPDGRRCQRGTGRECGWRQLGRRLGRSTCRAARVDTEGWVGKRPTWSQISVITWASRRGASPILPVGRASGAREGVEEGWRRDWGGGGGWSGGRIGGGDVKVREGSGERRREVRRTGGREEPDKAGGAVYTHTRHRGRLFKAPGPQHARRAARHSMCG